MAGPWENYAPIAEAGTPGPWEKYQAPMAESTPPSAEAQAQGPWTKYAPLTPEAPAPEGEERPRASFPQAVERGMRQVEGMLSGATEYIGERLGSEGITQWGREGREASEAAVKALPQQQQFSQIRGTGDFLQWVKEGAGTIAPQLVASAGAGIVGAAALPAAPVIGAVAGTTALGLPMGIGEVQGSVKEKDPNAVAPWAPLVGGSAIAALDSIVPGRIAGMLVKSLGKEVAEVVAERAVVRFGVARETGKQMTAEGITEAVQEAIGEVAGATGAGTAIDWAGLPTKMLDAGALGALIGGGTGAATGFAASRPSSAPPRSARETNDADIGTSSPDSVAIAEPGNISVVDTDTQVDQFAIQEEKEPSPIFYSQLQKLVEDKGPNIASSEQWMNSIKNWTQAGVKAEEIQWMKIPEYLTANGKKVTKQELLTHLRENLLDVQTVMRSQVEETIIKWATEGEGTDQTWKDQFGEFLIQKAFDPHGRERYWAYYTDPGSGHETPLSGGSFATLAQAQAAAQRHSDEVIHYNANVGKNAPKYQGYQLDGEKEGYVEILITLNPAFNSDPEMEAAKQAVDMAQARSRELYNQADNSPGGYYEAPQALRDQIEEAVRAEDDAYSHYENLKRKGTLKEPYRSGHWEEPNVLAHIRVSRRLDAEGKNVLYVEEIQSDWHQEGRKRGYVGEEPPDRVTRAQVDEAQGVQAAAENAYWDAVRAHPYFESLGRAAITRMSQVYYVSEHFNMQTEPDVQTVLQPLQLAYEQASVRAGELSDRYYEQEENSGGRKVPNAPFKGSAWVELAIKRILRYAADNGIERVAFTTGKIQSARWQASPGSQRQRGFAEFYDKIIPRIVDKWAKKLGGRTGMTNIPQIGVEVDKNIVRVRLAPNEFAYALVPYYTLSPDQLLTLEDYDNPNLALEQNLFPTEAAAATAKASLRLSEPAMFIDITDQMASKVKLGFTVFEYGSDDGTKPTVKLTADNTPQAQSLVPAAQKGAELVQQLAKRLKITKPIHIEIVKGVTETRLGSVTPEVEVKDLQDAVRAGTMSLEAAQFIVEKRAREGQAKSYKIKIYPDLFQTVEEMYTTMMHELGHIVDFEFFSKATPEVQLSLKAAYQQWVQQQATPNRKLRELLVSRNTFISVFYGNRKNIEAGLDPLISSLPPEKQRYWLSMSEWMAENVSKYLVTNEKPLSVVDRFFKALATQIRIIRDAFAKKLGVNVDPPKVLSDWLDSLITMEPLDYAAVEAERNRATREANQRAANADGHPEFPAVPMTQASVPIRNLLKKLGMAGHKGAGMHLAAVDRFNTFYQYMLSLVQVAARNSHIAPLQIYRELWQLLGLETANTMNIALTTDKAWAKLPPDQSDQLVKAMDYYANGHFLPDDEAAAGVVRRPTPAELEAMFNLYKVGPEAQAVFHKVVADYDLFLDMVKEVEIGEAMKLTDPAAQARVIVATENKFSEYRKRPYMPMMRYGEFTVTVRDAAGNMVAFHTFESQSARRQGVKKIEHDLLPGESIQQGVLPEEVRPLIGLPPGLLDKVRDRLGLSPSQIEALEQLKFDFSPVQSFKHRFARRKAVPGYSMDYRRGYMSYFFFGSKYLAKVKYSQPLLDQIKAVRDSARPLADSTRRGRIANFMTDHYHYTMNPKADWATFRQMATMWALGGVVSAATLNLSQMVVGSYPFLASKFGGLGVGDGRAMKALLKAGAQMNSTYRKRGNFDVSDQDMRALSEGVKEGIITEAQAHEMAAAAETDNLKPRGFSRTMDTFKFILDKSMWMFEMTEQANRRITFRAAWRLALEHPELPYVQNAVDKHQLAYTRLLEKGWPPNEAAAFVVAKDVVEETQYIYQQWASPKFMRGKARTVFIFKSFVQNTMFMLWNNPGARARSLLVMAFLGGLMGMPGGEDLRGIIKALAWRLFGRDFDIEDEARRFIVDFFDGKLPPDLVLHGAARRGFGLPAAMEMVGVPFPSFDRSKAVGLGTILPVDFGVLAGPHKDSSRAIAESAQKASGAAFGIGFNLYKFATESQLDWTNAKRWQLALPRSLQGLTKGFRYYANEEETNRFGNRVVRFDVNDTRHLAEIVGASMGYTPTRLAAQWDRIMAEREGIMYWNIRRETLMRQLWSARSDPQNYENVLQSIRNFNSQLPEAATLKRIDAMAIRRSFQSRARAQQAQESGTPRGRADVPIVRDIQRLYPEAQVDVRTVR